MRRYVHGSTGSLGVLLVFLAAGGNAAAQPDQAANTLAVAANGFDFVKRAGELEIFLDGKSFATYVWSDPQTTRPYFKQVHALGGAIQMTRHHPPREGDFQDHDTYHPGIWWGFGDVGGHDYWRLKAKIIGGQFIEEPSATKVSARFAVRNQLLTNEGDARFCEQTCRYRILRRENGILMICESTFVREEGDFWLGDQEEMGLAFRVATPLTVRNGGTIRDSQGRTDLKAIRTHPSDWCNYSGPIAGKHGGMMLMNDPHNFRKPWWHAVDTGLLIANPLGESELTGKGKQRQNVLVKKGEPFRLRYGCLIHLHENEEQFNPEKAYAEFLELLSEESGTKTAKTPNDLPKVPDGFQISIFGSEPRIYKPTSVCFDARGRLLVGQGPQYPRNRPDTHPDSVVMLMDTDNDGEADTTKTFATGFNSVQGMAWKGNDLYVANAPELTVVRDLDGDDEADEYVVVYTDLGNREHALHGLNFGPDGKLYMSKGNSKGHNQPRKYGYVAPRPFRELWDVVHPPDAPDSYPPQTYTKQEYQKTYHHWDDDWGREGGVLRCDPMGGNLEIVARGMRNPWDMTLDDGFNLLATDNDQDQGDRIIMPFFRAHFGWGHNYSSHWTGENHLPTVPISGPVFPGSGTGIVYYTHPHFPASHRHVFFINDWLHGTFVYRPTWDGALMQPVSGRWEAFASRGDGHTLYRPTDLEVGPDGSLYICGWGGDYHYDREAEGSWIFRVTNSQQSPPARATWWSAKRDREYAAWSVADLIQDLKSDVLPIWRVNAQDELVRRGFRVRDQLIESIESGLLDRSQQTWAVWALGRISADDDRIRQFILQLASPPKLDQAQGIFLNLRIQSLRIIAHWIRNHQRGELPDLVALALDDPEPRIRFEAVQAMLQSRQSHQIHQLLDRLAVEQDRLVFYAGWQALRELLDAGDRSSLLEDERDQVRLAALLSLQEQHEISLEAVLRLAERDPDERVRSWALTWAMNPSPPRKMPNERSRIEQEESVSMHDLIQRATAAKKAALRQVYLRMISRATYDKGDEGWREVRDFYLTLRDDSERALVIKPLSRENTSQPYLWEAMDGSLELQQAAVRGWVSLARRFGNSPEQMADALLSQMAVHPLAGRLDAATDALTRLDISANWRPTSDWDLALSKAFRDASKGTVQARLLALLLRIDQETLADGRLVREEIEQLARRDRPSLYASLASLQARLGMDLPIKPPPKATLDGVLQILPEADAERGEELFFNQTAATSCSTCHRIDGRGHAFAPDLSSIGLRADVRTIVQSILEPSASITEGYQLQTFALEDGSALSGAVLQESAALVRIVKTDGITESIDTAAIESRTKSDISAMPTGYGLLGDEQVADLTAYLLTCRHRAPTKASLEGTSN